MLNFMPNVCYPITGKFAARSFARSASACISKFVHIFFVTMKKKKTKGNRCRVNIGRCRSVSFVGLHVEKVHNTMLLFKKERLAAQKRAGRIKQHALNAHQAGIV